MESLIYFIVSIVLNSFLPIWLPWWVIFPVNFLLVFPFRLNKAIAFWLGGFAPAIGWVGFSLFLSFENNHVLVPRLASVLTLPHPVLFFVLVFLIPFLVGAFSTLSGVLFKKFFFHHAT